ncbi:hypothetical protein HY622_00240 [Candidatus Uhrbacteria bacterium]|nr:hypothetical protein [Candidatus Uhrbacteria bacterium]
MNTFLQQLRARATQGFVRTIIFPEAQDERVVAAAAILREENIVRPLFVGTSQDAARIRELGFDCAQIEEERANELEHILADARSSKIGTKDELTSDAARLLAHDPLFYAMYLLRLDSGDGLVAGAVRPTADVVRAGLWLIGKAAGIRTVSSSFYMVLPSFRGTASEEVLSFADCAVVPAPTAEQLADIAIAAARAREKIVGDEPRVALLSYSTKGSGGDDSSIAVVRSALQIVRKRRPEIIIDGELQVDTALIQSIANRKDPDGFLAGLANVLIFPSLDAANIAYKLVAHLVPGAQALGPLLQGMAKPMSDLSRGASVQDIVSIATMVASQASKRD